MKLIEVSGLYPEMCKVGPVARRWPNTRLSYLIFLLHESQCDVSQEEGGGLRETSKGRYKGQNRFVSLH